MSLLETALRYFTGRSEQEIEATTVVTFPTPNYNLVRPIRQPDDPAIMAMINHLAEQIPMYHMLECRVYFAWSVRAWTLLPEDCSLSDISEGRLAYWITAELADDMFHGGLDSDLKAELLEYGHDLLAYWAWKNDPQYNIKEGHQ